MPVSPALSVGLGTLIVAVVLLIAAVRILREYERGVVFFLGRFQSVKGPGLITSRSSTSI